MPFSGQVIGLCLGRQNQKYSSQSPCPLPPNIFLILSNRGLTHFTISTSSPLQSSHLQSIIFSKHEFDVFFVTSINIFRASPGPWIKTKLLKTKPSCQTHLKSLLSLHPATLAILQFYGKSCSPSIHFPLRMPF